MPKSQLIFLKEPEIKPLIYTYAVLNKDKFIQLLGEISVVENLNSIKNKLLKLKNTLIYPKNDPTGILNIGGETVSLRRDILFSQIEQILEVQTLERAKYYLKRLSNSIQKTKTSKINDINLMRWKEYDEIVTDSLWMLDKRDTKGAHLGWYWGNFVPQIPHQMLLRYTKKGEWVLDPFVGSGTTLIECRRLGRNGLGIELNSEVAEKAKELINQEENRNNIKSEVITGDSRAVDLKTELSNLGIEKVQLLLLHPPYHDIRRFSEDEKDLSNAENEEEFLKMFGQVLDNVSYWLEEGRYLILVIGDKYARCEWIPLGFYCMSEVLKRGYLLKSTIVKNFEQTRGKRNQEELWRYRALVGGFYVFKHEYIMLFQKKQTKEPKKKGRKKIDAESS